MCACSYQPILNKRRIMPWIEYHLDRLCTTEPGLSRVFDVQTIHDLLLGVVVTAHFGLDSGNDLCYKVWGLGLRQAGADSIAIVP